MHAVVPVVTVLVIDDDADLRGAMADALHDAGYVAVTACDGGSALVLLKSLVAQVIVVDLQMPGMDGREFIRQWNAEPGSRAAVILMTGSEVHIAPPAGCAVLLPKPFTLHALVAAIRALGLVTTGQST